MLLNEQFTFSSCVDSESSDVTCWAGVIERSTSTLLQLELLTGDPVRSDHIFEKAEKYGKQTKFGWLCGHQKG